MDGVMASLDGGVSQPPRRRDDRSGPWGLVWGPLVSVSTVVTANHFLIDLGAGLAVTAAGLVVGLALSRRAISPMRPARRTERLTPSSISTGGR